MENWKKSRITFRWKGCKGGTGGGGWQCSHPRQGRESQKGRQQDRYKV